MDHQTRMATPHWRTRPRQHDGTARDIGDGAIATLVSDACRTEERRVSSGWDAAMISGDVCFTTTTGVGPTDNKRMITVCCLNGGTVTGVFATAYCVAAAPLPEGCEHADAKDGRAMRPHPSSTPGGRKP